MKRTLINKYSGLIRKIENFYKIVMQKFADQYDYELTVEDIFYGLENAAREIYDESETASNALIRIAHLYKKIATNAKVGFNYVYNEIENFKRRYPNTLEVDVQGETVQDILNQASIDLTNKAANAKVDIKKSDPMDVVKALDTYTIQIESEEAPSPFGESPTDFGMPGVGEGGEGTEGDEGVTPPTEAPEGLGLTPEEAEPGAEGEDVEPGLSKEEEEARQLEREKEEITGIPTEKTIEDQVKDLTKGLSEDGDDRKASIRSTGQRKDKIQKYKNSIGILNTALSQTKALIDKTKKEIEQTNYPDIKKELKTDLVRYVQAGMKQEQLISLYNKLIDGELDKKLDTLTEKIKNVHSEVIDPIADEIFKNEQYIRVKKEIEEAKLNGGKTVAELKRRKQPFKAPKLSKDFLNEIKALQKKNKELWEQWVAETDEKPAYDAIKEEIQSINSQIMELYHSLRRYGMELENKEIEQKLLTEEDPYKIKLLTATKELNDLLISRDQGKALERKLREQLVAFLTKIVDKKILMDTPENIANNNKLIADLEQKIADAAKLKVPVSTIRSQQVAWRKEMLERGDIDGLSKTLSENIANVKKGLKKKIVAQQVIDDIRVKEHTDLKPLSDALANAIAWRRTSEVNRITKELHKKMLDIAKATGVAKLLDIESNQHPIIIEYINQSKPYYEFRDNLNKFWNMLKNNTEIARDEIDNIIKTLLNQATTLTSQNLKNFNSPNTTILEIKQKLLEMLNNAAS